MRMGADYVELANTQFYGWAWHNREQLMPSRAQVERAEEVTRRFRERTDRAMRIFFVVPDYFERRPKPCMNGLGSIFLTVTPDGTALPCHAARMLPGLDFPNVKSASVEHVWFESQAFNHFRGFDWMKEPCRSCPEKTRDFGGCRCQAYLLTGRCGQCRSGVRLVAASPLGDRGDGARGAGPRARGRRSGCGEAADISLAGEFVYAVSMISTLASSALRGFTVLFVAALIAETAVRLWLPRARSRRCVRTATACPSSSRAGSRSRSSSALPTTPWPAAA